MKIDIEKLTEALRAHDPELADLLAASGEIPTSGIQVNAQYDARADQVTMRFSPTVSASVLVIVPMLIYGDERGGLHYLAAGVSSMGSGGNAAFTGSLFRTDVRGLYGGKTLLAWALGRIETDLIGGDAEVEIPR